MKPGDHPEFFRLAPPSGTSRESTIRLDSEGRFWHDGELVENPALASALHTWISRHPDDGRFILTNGYDWTYFAVDDAPYYVLAVNALDDRIELTLSDGTSCDMFDTAGVRTGRDEALYVRVKDGSYEAKFTRHAQNALACVLVEGQDGMPMLRIGSRTFAVPCEQAS